jgi:hypothetical protein
LTIVAAGLLDAIDAQRGTPTMPQRLGCGAPVATGGRVGTLDGAASAVEQSLHVST